jgi:hypothetical protein
MANETFTFRGDGERKPRNNLLLSPAPRPEDLIASTNSFVQVFMYAVDFSDLELTLQCNMQSVTLNITIESVLSGLQVFVDDFLVNTPNTIVSWQNHTISNSSPMIFSDWSIGRDRLTHYVVPPPNSISPVITAYFQSV